ncbi:hypothetical protein Syun_031689 [Stephania yunnanensis]|uniref:Uncharacterized protein n=1 Tax=Stephania yunnanensis TaxID=152371 RepID=A0AAP0HFA8_9MAGN
MFGRCQRARGGSTGVVAFSRSIGLTETRIVNPPRPCPTELDFELSKFYD